MGYYPWKKYYYGTEKNEIFVVQMNKSQVDCKIDLDILPRRNSLEN